MTIGSALRRSPMAKFLFVRVAGALGITSLALIFVGLIPFLSVAPPAGAGFRTSTPGFTVNHEFKGDRLPIVSPTHSAISRNEPDSRRRLLAREEIPVGCDPVFSPVTNPKLANYYGRCAT
jgi:hypothetical protein